MTARLSATPLRSGDVEVRAIRVADAKPLERLLRENRRWLATWEAQTPGGWGSPPGSYPLAPAIRDLRQSMKRGSMLPYVVLYRGQLVGQLTVADISWGAIRSGQIGYWIAEGFAGLGIIPRAVALVIDDTISRLGLHRIEICLRPENAPSRRVVDKLGLRFEGLRERYIYIDGDWRDHHCFAVTAEELTAPMLSRLS